jgi:hypothetical protein
LYGPFAWETVASSCAVLGSRESLEAVSTGRVLIWSGDQHFAIAVGRHLAQRDFEVLEWRGYASARSWPELIIADIDRLPLMRDWRSIRARVPGPLVTAAVATLAASDVRLHSTDPAIARPTATVVAATPQPEPVQG